MTLTSDSRGKQTPPHRPHHVQQPSVAEEEEEEEEEVEGGPTLQSQFVLFAKRTDPSDPGTHMALSQIDVWMKQAGILKVRQLTRTDTGVCYFNFKKYKLDFDEFKEFLNLLSARKKIPVEEFIEKLVKCGPPMSDEELKNLK